MLKIIYICRSRTLTFILSHEFFILATDTLVVHADNIPGSFCQIDLELVLFVRHINCIWIIVQLPTLLFLFCLQRLITCKMEICNGDFFKIEARKINTVSDQTGVPMKSKEPLLVIRNCSWDFFDQSVHWSAKFCWDYKVFLLMNYLF
jgi:hypothetical protein